MDDVIQIRERLCETERRLRESEARFQSIVQRNADGILIIDRQGIVRFANPIAASFLSCPADHLVGQTFGYPVLSGEMVEIDLVGSNEVPLTVEMRVSDTTWQDVERGLIPCFLISLRDTTLRRQAEESLRQALESAHRHESQVLAMLRGARAVLEYRNFADAARTIFDACKDIIGAQSGYVALINEDRSENHLLFLDAGGLDCTVDTALPMPIRGLREQAYCTGQPVFDNGFMQSQWVSLMPFGHVRLDNVLFAPLMLDGQSVGLLGLANKPGEFTDQDAQLASAFSELAAIALRNSQILESLQNEQERLRASLQENQVLMQEIHHRVKNNLQVVVSLLDFQIQFSQEPSVTAALSDCQQRIYSMALIHEQLYRSAELSQIDLALYINDLAMDLLNAFEMQSQHIRLDVQAQSMALDIKQAIPCGLLIHELISNAFKHAFPTGSGAAWPDACITVRVEALPARRCALTVRDNGRGLPADFRFPDPNSLGLFLVDTLVRQLGGQIEWFNESGAGCRIEFGFL